MQKNKQCIAVILFILFSLAYSRDDCAEQKISHKPPMPSSMKKLFYIIAQMEEKWISSVFTRVFLLFIRFAFITKLFSSTSLPTQTVFFESIDIIEKFNCLRERRFMITAEILITLIYFHEAEQITERMKI